MSDKIETPAAGAAAGTNEATAAAAETKTAKADTTAAELKALKKESAAKDKRIEALEAENSQLANAVDEKDELLLNADIQVRDLVKERDALKDEIEALKAAQGAIAEDNRVLYTSAAGDTYEVTHPVFRFKGDEHKAAELIASGQTEVLEDLIAAKSFILKKV